MDFNPIFMSFLTQKKIVLKEHKLCCYWGAFSAKKRKKIINFFVGEIASKKWLLSMQSS